MVSKNKSNIETPEESLTPQDISEGNIEITEPEKEKPKQKSKIIDLSFIEERNEYQITIIKKFGMLSAGTKKIVSGNVAKELIKKGLAELSK